MFFVASHGYRAYRRRSSRSWAVQSQPGNGNDMDTYADDPAELFNTLDLHDALLVGHSEGGSKSTRDIGRYGTSRLAKVMLVDAIPPLMLKTGAGESRRHAH